MQSGFEMTTLVFLGLAVFVGWKLWSVLGTKTGSEAPPVDPFRRDAKPDGTSDAANPPDAQRESNVIRLPGAANDAAANAANVSRADRWVGLAPAGSPLAAGLDQIIAAEPGFDAKGFVQGAKGAYEMIVTAFARGDRATLKGLLAKDVYDGFENAITEREARGETTQTTFVSLDDAKLMGIEVKDRTAQVTLQFNSKMITVTRDAKGAIIEGGSEAVADMTDVWTFSRALGTRDPNWWLIATESGA
jgi:predicted lipid-binding transport protein (Tim44 family)